MRRPVSTRATIASFTALLTLTAGALAVGTTSAAAATTTTVVSSGDVSPTTWAENTTSTPPGNTGAFSFVAGPSTPPGGIGSLQLTIASGKREWFNNYSYGKCAAQVSGNCTSPLPNWTTLSSIDALKFSTYRASGTTFPTLNVEADYQGTGLGMNTTFVFVPAGGTSNAWQTWDALNPSSGTWYSTTNTGAGTPFNCNFMALTCNHSWAEIQTGYPNARVIGGIGANVGPNAGTGTDTFSGNIDDFTVGVSGATTVYDFEPDCTTDCYVNAATGNDANSGQLGDPLATIQAGIGKVSPGGVVHVAAGTYVENVTVPKGVRITGAGSTTVVEPATANPDCNGSGGSSLCSGASNVFLVQHSDVTIDHLKIDGDNPNLGPSPTHAPGTTNIDARNGIVQDFKTAPCSSATTCNNLSVHDVTVTNAYLRGIYASSGGTFNFTNNTVSNVTSDPQSVAIFNFGGAGTMSGNHVSNASDAIAANHSAGTMFTNNVITASGSGVHTDNAGDTASSQPDVISGNQVSSCTTGGYGVWAFVAYKAPTLSNNTVSGCDFGMAALASCNLGGTNLCPGGVIPAVTFSNNNVTTTGAGALGLYVTTNSMGFGNGDVKANADHNIISGPGKSVGVEETGTAHATVAVHNNSLKSAQNTGATTVDGTCNWWGQAAGPLASQIQGSITFTPFLTTSNLNGNSDGSCNSPGGSTGVPGKVRSVFAVPGNGRATVSWKAPLSDGGSPITGYLVTPIKAGVAQPVRVFNSTKTTQTVGGLSNGASYKFQLAARNATGTSATSTSSGGIRVGAPGAPPQPTVSQPASGSLKVKFTAPSGNGSPITSFTATCSSSNGGVSGSQTGKSNPITVTGLTAGKTYTCRVAATNSRGTGPRSVPSAPISA